MPATTGSMCMGALPDTRVRVARRAVSRPPDPTSHVGCCVVSRVAWCRSQLLTAFWIMISIPPARPYGGSVGGGCAVALGSWLTRPGWRGAGVVRVVRSRLRTWAGPAGGRGARGIGTRTLEQGTNRAGWVR